MSACLEGWMVRIKQIFKLILVRLGGYNQQQATRCDLDSDTQTSGCQVASCFCFNIFMYGSMYKAHFLSPSLHFSLL
jgi:hypothetical protein